MKRSLLFLTLAVAALRRRLGASSIVRAEMASHPIGGVTVGVISGSDLSGPGATVRRHGKPQDGAKYGLPHRLHHKQFTGVMLLQLVEQGEAQLADPVKKFPAIGQIRGGFQRRRHSPHAARHASCGLSREPDDAKFLQDRWRNGRRSCLALPHVRYQYDGDAIFIFEYRIRHPGVALSQAAGSAIRIRSKHILQPLGMEHTAPEPARKCAALAKGYVGKAIPRSREGPSTAGYKVPNGALYDRERSGEIRLFEIGADRRVCEEGDTARQLFALLPDCFRAKPGLRRRLHDDAARRPDLHRTRRSGRRLFGHRRFRPEIANGYCDTPQRQRPFFWAGLRVPGTGCPDA